MSHPTIVIVAPVKLRLCGLFLIAQLVLCLPAFIHSALGQGIVWGVGASVSFHDHNYEAPLDFWDNAGLLFPGVAVWGELPLSFIEGPLGEKLFLRTGVRYTRLASRVNWKQVTANNQTFSGRFSIGQHYLAIPAQFRLNLGRTPVYMLAGAELGVLLFATKKSDTLTPVEARTSMKEGVGNDIKRLNVSLSGGVGARLSPQIRLFTRYNAGLSNAKKEAERTVLVTDWRTREIEVGVEFIFTGQKDP